MRVLLFALTGFGTIALEALLDKKIKPIAIVTRREKNKYPYFKCKNISLLATDNKIRVHYDKTFVKKKVDLCLVATYHKKINIKKSNYKKAFNIHPSLLPAFKGKDPIKDAINSRAKYTGVTIHKLTKKFDEGKIYKQYKVKIDRRDLKSDVTKKMRNHYYKAVKYILRNLKSELF